MVLGTRRPDAQAFDGDTHHNDSDHGQWQGHDHGQSAPEEAAEQKHAAQGDKVHLDEVDDADGVVNHAKTQRDKRINGAAGDTRKHELHEILKAAHRSSTQKQAQIKNGSGYDSRRCRSRVEHREN
ncbi:hypothetical protein DESC_770061 [Desulfosarcina cetonica]|nr:hypothetical protein DESC_770061 [Desulfosarcina cetonica]